ncbi:MAG: phosphoribosylglycinamide formyltransferase [Acidimicrobiales bacterium]
MGTTDQPRLAVLASGGGSNLAAMLSAGLVVTVVLVDRPCGAEKVAKEAGVPVERVIRESFGSSFDRDGYTEAVTRALAPHGVDTVAMAGFGTVLGQVIHDAYPGRILNTHPALLPAYPGWHAVEEALAAGATVTGCTVHVATLEVDSGPILATGEVPIRPGDTAETLHARIKAVEHRIYPRAIADFLGAADMSATGLPADRSPATGLPAADISATGLPADRSPATGLPATGRPAPGLPAADLPPGAVAGKRRQAR